MARVSFAGVTASACGLPEMSARLLAAPPPPDDDEAGLGNMPALEVAEERSQGEEAANFGSVCFCFFGAARRKSAAKFQLIFNQT